MSDQSRSGGFTPWIMAALGFGCVVLFLAFLTLSAFAPELRRGQDGGPHALSPSAVGLEGVARLLEAQGQAVTIGRWPDENRTSDSLVILTPNWTLSADDLDALAGAATLIVLPKWDVQPNPERPGWVQSNGLLALEGVEAVLEDVAPPISVTRRAGWTSAPLAFGASGQPFPGEVGGRPARLEHLQTIIGSSLEPVVVDGAGQIVIGRFYRDDGSAVLVLSDPDFLNNHGIDAREVAQVGLALIDLSQGQASGIVFDVTLHGLGATQSALRLAFEPPFLGATLALALAALVLGWRAASRFGAERPPQRAIPLGKAALADNTAALLRLTDRDLGMGEDYARLVGAEVARRFGVSGANEAETRQRLDALAASLNVTPSFSAIARAAATARSRRAQREAALRLHAWKEDIARATR